MRRPLIDPALVRANWPLVSLILFSFFRSLLGHETGVNPEAAARVGRWGGVAACLPLLALGSGLIPWTNRLRTDTDLPIQ